MVNTMKRLAASLILLFIACWSYAQNDLTIYRKNGKKVEVKNATTETRASNVYITDGNGKTKVYSQSSLDSITGLPEGVMNFNTDVTLYTKRGDKYEIKNATIKTKDGEVYVREANGTISIYSMSLLDSVSGRTDDDIVYNENEPYDLSINDPEATPLDDEIIEIKKDLNEFRKARGGGYFLQALGAGIAIAGSYLVISDANNETFTGTSKGLLLTGVGSGLSLVGFILTWGAGDKINYDNDIAKHNKRKRKNR